MIAYVLLRVFLILLLVAANAFFAAAEFSLVSVRDTRIQQLIASRLSLRKGHFMPPGLLVSQFKTLEPPGADENPATVSIDASVETIVDDIISQLGLSPAHSGAPRRNRS